jgi:RNA polymerase sigma factor (sigma-70 family)
MTRLLRLRSDEQLVALFRAGSEEAFAALHDRYRTRLGAYVRRLLGGAREDAEDVLQDVFVRAYRGLRRDGRPMNVPAWLYRVAHNRCMDEMRRPRALAPLEDDARVSWHDPLAEALRRDELRRLVQDIGRLPAQQRSALVARELSDVPYADVAAALDVTIPALKSLLVRARTGLVAAAAARDADCGEIRDELRAARERGVKAPARAGRHLRDCAACRAFRPAARRAAA